ncbi:hypothetical protein PFISCL1PPCAC_15851, partial [Pristionchus fissidentatus]
IAHGVQLSQEFTFQMSGEVGIAFLTTLLRQKQTPKCFENGPQCATTALYYFECCEDDCCVKAQPLVLL